MSSTSAPNAPRSPLVVWWVIWLGLLGGVIFVYATFLERRQPVEHAWGIVETMACVNVALSAVVRWLVLPRFREAQRAFPIFIVGMALAESAAFFGIFLSAYANELFVLGTVGMMQFVPFFVARLLKPSGTDVMPRG